MTPIFARRNHRVVCAVAPNLPAVVVEQHVVSATEQYSVGEVGLAPDAERGDVVCFTPGWGPVAVWPATAAVADGECDALRRTEEPPRATEIKRLARSIQDDWEGATIAEEASRRCG